jgi:hypothetical protein
MKKNLLVISDGNGIDNNFKKWPFYLSLLLSKTHKIINRSVVGASNELIFLQLCETVNSIQIDQAIIQWSIPNRVDVVLDSFWSDQAQIDPVYHFNIIKSNNNNWWVTSGSANPYIQDYHKRYIKYWQALQRTQAFIMAAAELLKSRNIEFAFSLCYDYDFIDPNKDIISSYPWISFNGLKGYSEFRNHSKHRQYDTGLPQPHTLINLDWINTVLKPCVDFIGFDDRVYSNLEQAVFKNL